MGTLGGHLLPGTFFIIFGIWWGFVTAIRYVQSQIAGNNSARSLRNGGGKMGSKRKAETAANGGYVGTVTMPCICLPCDNIRRAPTESYLKLVLAFIALVIEAYTGVKFNVVKMPESHHEEMETSMGSAHSHVHARHTDDDHMQAAGKMVYHSWTFEKGNAQHITMYSAFILGSVIEILMHYGVPLPKKLDYALGIMAFTVEGFLFAFHLHGKEPDGIYLHVLLVYAIFACAVMCALEAYNDKQILFTYGRMLCTILQGTWFYQVGFMLYPPTDNPAFKWDLSDHSSIMIITVCFCWHAMLIVIGLLLQYWFVSRLYLRGGERLKAKWDELIYIDSAARTSRDSNSGNSYKLFVSHETDKNGSVHANDTTKLFAMNSDDDEIEE